MNIILITQGISRVVKPLLNSEHKILAVLESAPRGYAVSRAKNQLVKNIISLKNSFKPGSASLQGLCKIYKVPYRFMTSSKDPGLEGWVRAFDADLIVVFSMSQLLEENIFKIPRYGTINLHTSYLPEYRGPNPDFWLILRSGP